MSPQPGRLRGTAPRDDPGFRIPYVACVTIYSRAMLRGRGESQEALGAQGSPLVQSKAPAAGPTRPVSCSISGLEKRSFRSRAHAFWDSVISSNGVSVYWIGVCVLPFRHGFEATENGVRWPETRRRLKTCGYGDGRKGATRLAKNAGLGFSWRGRNTLRGAGGSAGTAAGPKGL